jgi:hypothetical protein
MDDVFKDAMKEIFRDAPPELVAGFKDKMRFIQSQYKHSKTTVQSCLEGMDDPPKLVELLVAAYVVNGGLLFKHGDLAEEDDDAYTRLMLEMEELQCSPSCAEEKTPVKTGAEAAPLHRAGQAADQSLRVQK